MIARIAAAQESDGYLYTWRTMHPDSPVHDWIAYEFGEPVTTKALRIELDQADGFASGLYEWEVETAK